MGQKSSFRYYNPNPFGRDTSDCVVRALTLALDMNWDDTYKELCRHGFQLGLMPNDNAAWETYLIEHGYERRILPNTCPACYTLEDFCRDHAYGDYVVATGSHVIFASDGLFYDTSDSGNEIVTYYFQKERT